MRKSSLRLLPGLLVIALFGCSSNDGEPANPIVQPDTVPDACDSPASLDFFVEEASLIPIPREDLTFENLGLPGAESLAEEMMSSEGLCDLDISPATQALFDEVQQLIAAGNDEQARDLLATMLENSKTASPMPVPEHATGERSRVRDLLQAAALDMLAGGDGQSHLNNAMSVFSTWAEGSIQEASIKEALQIAADAYLLGLNELGDAAVARARALINQEMAAAVDAFDPCTATTDDVNELLDTLAKQILLTGSQGAEYAQTMEVAGQALIRNGSNPQVVREFFGDWIEEAACTGFIFDWTRTVSDGLTFTGSGSSCDSVLWEGTVNLSGTNSSGASVSSSGSFSFSLPAGIFTAQTTVETSGIMTVNGEALTFTDPLPMTFVFMEDTMQAEVTIASDGSGSLITPAGPITFASVFTAEPTFGVTLDRNPDCP